MDTAGQTNFKPESGDGQNNPTKLDYASARPRLPRDNPLYVAIAIIWVAIPFVLAVLFIWFVWHLLADHPI